jgi:hypothetical protein
MRRVIVFALTFTLLGQTSVPLAAGPLLESAQRAAQELAQSQSEPPNAAEARRVATDLGVGRHVAVKLTSGKTLRGHLHAINDDRLVLLLDRESRPVEIAYREVQELGPNLSTGAKVAIWVGVGVAVAVVILAIAVNKAAGELGF